MSNLPPGVTDSMIPGNRWEDQEFNLNVFATFGDLRNMVDFVNRYPPSRKQKNVHDLHFELSDSLEAVLEQLEVEDMVKRTEDGRWVIGD